MPNVYDLSKPVDWGNIKGKIYADTNIISPIYYDQAAAVPNQINLPVSRVYQQALRNMFAIGLQLHVSSIVIFEMINLFIKWDHKIYNMTQGNRIGDLKQYRELQSEMNSRSIRYPLIYQQICATSNIIIEDTTIYAKDIPTYINTMGCQSMDPNDFVIVKMTELSKATLITDDHDYGSQIINCDIMTRNQTLINKCIQFGYTQIN